MPKRNSEDIVVGMQTRHTTTNEHGEVTSETETNRIKVAQEPDYVKLYLNTILVFKDLPKQMNAVLHELLKLMTYADPDADHGGQLIMLNSYGKEQIVKRLKIKANTLDQHLTKLTKSGIIKRVGYGTYQANPNMFGRGDWLDIKAIKATFDFNTGTVEADIQTQDGKDETAN